MEKAQNKKFVKVVLAIFAIGMIYWFGPRTDPQVSALNQALKTQGSKALQDYPYQFSVDRLEDGAAIMGTPRSFDVPVYRMIGALHPNLSGKSPDNPDFIKAEKELAQIQSEARQIILAQSGVASVKWELDRDWLIAHNIQLN